MIRKALLALFLSGCGMDIGDTTPMCQYLPDDMRGEGKTKLYINNYSDEIKDTLNSLVIEANGLANFKLITFDKKHPRSFAIDTSTDKIVQISKSLKEAVLGVCETGNVYLMQKDTSYDFDNKETIVYEAYIQKAVLAHELGHAMGLVHTDYGLMTPSINLDCVKQEAVCLIRALKDQGIM